jgi:hypothetical protein
MKITKRQLRRIIKEEKLKIQEAYPIGGESSPAWEAFEAAAFDVASNMIDAGMEADGVLGAMQDTLEEIVAGMDIEDEDEGRPTPTPHDPYGRRRI